MEIEFFIGSDHPILRDHQAYGRNILPGLAYIDLLYQIFRDLGYVHSELELRSTTILQPLAVLPGHRVKLRIIYTQMEAKYWKVSIEGRTQRGGEISETSTQYATAEMHEIPPVIFHETLKPTIQIDSLGPSMDLEEIYWKCSSHELHHSGCMKGQGTVHKIEDGILVDANIDATAINEAENSLFYPALIDCAALCSGELLDVSAAGEKKLFLPIFYESFRASDTLQTHCFARIKESARKRKNEFRTFSVEFFNSNGKKTAQLTNFTVKLVRDARLLVDEGRSNSSKSAPSIPSIIDVKVERDLERQVVAAEGFIKKLISEKVQTTPENLQIDVGYYELGLTSANLLEMVRDVSEKIGERISPTLFFEYTNISELVTFLTDRYPVRFGKEKIKLTEQDGAHGERESDFAFTKSKKEINQRQPERGIEQASDALRDIAVIGMGARFPEAKTLAEFWANLAAGKDCITEIPKSRWDWAALNAIRSASGRNLSRWGGFLQDADCFDPQFFRISPREAELMDPQERIFLEICWAAIEDGGYTPATLTQPKGVLERRAVGVFAGVMHKDYSLIGAQAVGAGLAFPLSLNCAQIANRVSYFCNFNGPSMAVDTVCSSSLVAVHLAIQSLRSGECDVALAGGVNLSLHPGKYMSYGLMDMHATDGRCRTFGKGGDGYVSSEGVGAVLLKPLSHAIRDGDQIYAVIKGSSVNHVGAASGFTVPSPVMQADMILQCIEDAGVDPRTISYVEAHGTGTSLGDPIEIQGLAKAFRQHTLDEQFCAIGSVKSNIGHAESAAGISGLIKVALQLKHRVLVPSLNSTELNPYIELEGSPFYVQRQLEDWAVPKIVEGDAPSATRRAGLSSFGATGTNAHLILEEFHAEGDKGVHTNLEPPAAEPAIIVLSAKNPERLRAHAQNLMTALLEESRRGLGDRAGEIGALHGHPARLIDIAFTLQVGREEMEERLAFVSSDIQEAFETLECFLRNEDASNGDYYRGSVKRGAKAVNASGGNRRPSEQRASSSQLKEIVKAWVSGASIAWHSLYGGSTPRRVSLPTYPFAKERYWIPRADEAHVSVSAPAATSLLHPLVQRNTSDFFAQRYSASLKSHDLGVLEIRDQGHHALLRSSQLEMARAAAAFALGGGAPSAAVTLKDVTWSQCAVLGAEPLEIHISMALQESGAVNYEIYSEQSSSAGRVIYSRGAVLQSDIDGDAGRLDLVALRAQHARRTLDRGECYASLQACGLDYDGRYRIIDSIGFAHDRLGRVQALAKLSPRNDEGADRCAPSDCVGALEAAVQACLLLVLEAGREEPKAPLARIAELRELQLIQGCDAAAWAWIRQTSDYQVFDVDLCDAHGNACAVFRDLCFDAIEGREDAAPRQRAGAGLPIAGSPDKKGDVALFEEVWKKAGPLVRQARKNQTLICFLSDPEKQKEFARWVTGEDSDARVVFVRNGDRYERFSVGNYSINSESESDCKQVLESIGRELGKVDGILYLWPTETPRLVREYSPIVRLIQAIASTGNSRCRLMLSASCGDHLSRCHADSWLGFQRSLRLVLPDLDLAILILDAATDASSQLARVVDEYLAGESGVRYMGGEREVCRVLARSLESGGVDRLRHQGTYLVTGGCGALGLLFATHLAQTRAANLILTGRSALDDKLLARIHSLEKLGSRVMYLQADVCDLAAMEGGLLLAEARFGPVHGVIHAAGVLEEASLLQKSAQEFHEVIAAKVDGTLVLDQLFSGKRVDFICYFSSSSAALGDFGSCDYAVGNRFQMAYGRREDSADIEMTSRASTWVIQWPLWRDGGMGLRDNASTQMYLASSGQRALETEEGLKLFEQLLGQDAGCHLVMAGQLQRMQGFLDVVATDSARGTCVTGLARHASISRPPELAGLSISQCVEWHLMQRICEVLKVSREKLDMDSSFSDFGFDSITLGEYARLLSQDYDITIGAAVFFSYSTVRQLTLHLLDEYSREVSVRFAEAELAEPAPDQTKSVQASSNVDGLGRSNRLSARPSSATPNDHSPEAIAIIGMSGRFPDARNVDELWRIFEAGRDVVKEIPADRMKWHFQVAGDPEELPLKWKKSGLIPGVDEFDPLFFEISPLEAENMDPRQRLLLQEAWNSLEDAGYGPEQLRVTKTGMFVGIEQGDYQFLTGNKGNITSNHDGILAARLAYHLNLHGPVMAINTACSSSLTAVHQACLSLRNGECDTAIAAGAGLLLTSQIYRWTGEAGMLSDDGKCFAFDSRANGMVPAEAVAAVVLKRLSQAEMDGDPIYAVIAGSGINYDGKSNGMTAPSGSSQTSLLKSIYSKYKIQPEKIEYVVAHGTGTRLGDSIEINALNDVFKSYGEKKRYCALTSTKTNLGHTLAASGLVSLICLVQAMRSRIIPASLHCVNENDVIDWGNSPLYVNKKKRSWPQAGNQPIWGGVSAFGMSGTNAHLVVRSFQEAKVEMPVATRNFLLMLSAKTETALQEKIKAMLDWLLSKNTEDINLLEMSYTLLCGRHHFSHRCAIVTENRNEAIYALEQALSGKKAPQLFVGNVERGFTGNAALRKYANDLLISSEMLRDDGGMHRESYGALAEFYCQGYELFWEGLFKNWRQRKIHLPAYPFAKEKYWSPNTERSIPKNRATFKKLAGFDIAFYNSLLDELAVGDISVDDAFQKAKNHVQ